MVQALPFSVHVLFKLENGLGCCHVLCGLVDLNGNDFVFADDWTRLGIVLWDSIPKNVKTDRTTVSFYRGDKILQLANRIVFGQISVAGFYYILIHVVINDLSEWVRKDLIWAHTVHDLLNRYKALYKVLRRRNKSAIIMYSSILAYADKFNQFFPLIQGINFALEKWCVKSGRTRVFVASHAQFLHKGKPKHESFARADSLHPNRVGTDDLQFLSTGLEPRSMCMSKPSQKG